MKIIFLFAITIFSIYFMSLRLKFLGFVSVVAFAILAVFVFAFRSYHKLPSCDADFVKETVVTNVKSNFDAINKVLEPVNNSYELVGLSDFKNLSSAILGGKRTCSVMVSYKVNINNKGDKKQFDSSSAVNFSVEYKSFSDRKNNLPTVVISDGKKKD